MRYGDSGPGVKELQLELIKKGYSLPQSGADGHLGEETWEALQRFSRDKGLGWNPSVPDGVVAELRDGTSPGKPSPTASTRLPAPGAEGIITLVDLRKEQGDPAPKTKVVAGRTVRRNPTSVTGIVLHQTAVEFGVTRAQVLAAAGNAALAQQRRGLNVACHALAFREGWVAWVNELRSYVHHANLLNATTLGLEVEGVYPGLKGGRAWGGVPTPLDERTILAARAAVRLLVEEGRLAGMPIEFIYAHRQSSGDRRSDPGEELWKAVVVDWAVPVLGLKTRPALTVGDGRPVPVEWDPAGVGAY